MWHGHGVLRGHGETALFGEAVTLCVVLAAAEVANYRLLVRAALLRVGGGLRLGGFGFWGLPRLLAALWTGRFS